MNTKQIEAALNNVEGELSVAYKATVAAGEKDPQQLNGLRSLGRARQAVDKVRRHLADAVDKTTAKPKAEKKKGDSGKK